MKIENWRNIVPFKFYLTSLDNQIKKVRNILLKMHQDGPLLIKYVIEDNKELMAETIEMLKMDYNVQVLLGDKLKQDQFKFFYETVKVIHESAIKNELINYESNHEKMDDIISRLLALKSVLHIRNIQLKKADDERKLREKGINPDENKEKKDPTHMTEEEIYAMKMEGTDANLSEAQREQAKMEQEIKKYGRMWMWEGYFNLKNKELWLETAEALKHINDHVL